MGLTYLAVDGGNSKTDVVLGTTDGAVLGRATGPGSNHQNIGLPEALTRLRTLVDRVRAESGHTGPVDRAEFRLAGADLPPEVTMLTDAVTAQDWATEYVVANDLPAILRAGTDAPDAVAVVCGAGINAGGRAADGRWTGFPALGEISGDWGGGQFLGAQALWHAARSEDRRGPSTVLERAVPAHFGLSTTEQLVTAIHFGGIGADRLVELPPVLFAVADAGDGVARELVARLAVEITTMVRVCAVRLGLLTEPYDVVLGGGILRARHRLLHDAIVSGVTEYSPRATVRVVTAPPVLGAALSALDALAAPAEAHALLRTALA